MNRFLSFIVGLMGLLLITPDLSAQNGYEIRGTVTDQSGQPVIGATVLEKGTTNGLSTDIDAALPRWALCCAASALPPASASI